MKHLIVIFLTLLSFAAYSQDDPGLDLEWESFIDSTDFTIVNDTLDMVPPLDSIITIDTVYATKYKTTARVEIVDGTFGKVKTTIEYIRTYEEQAAALLSIMKAEFDEKADFTRKSMKQNANAISAKTAYEEFTGEANAYVAAYNEIWPKIPSLRILSTITDTSDVYYIGDVSAQPNAVGIVRDSNNVIVARIFPLSLRQWRVVIANNGVVGNGVIVELSSDDGRRYYMPSADPNIGRVIIILDQNIN